MSLIDKNIEDRLVSIAVDLNTGKYEALDRLDPGIFSDHHKALIKIIAPMVSDYVRK